MFFHMYLDFISINVAIKGLFHAKIIRVKLYDDLGVLGVTHEDTVINIGRR